MALGYNVDIVFVIDATSYNIVALKEKVIFGFYDAMMQGMKYRCKTIQKVRVKVIIFRDYLANSKPILTTSFFNFPDEANELRTLLGDIKAEPGGDSPEDALEALAYAIRSDWDYSCEKSRSIIVLFTDAPAHPLGFGAKSPKYPKEMAKDISELTAWWDNADFIKQSAKRLLLFAPETPEWCYISSNWLNVFHYPLKTGEGLLEMTFDGFFKDLSTSSF